MDLGWYRKSQDEDESALHVCRQDGKQREREEYTNHWHRTEPTMHSTYLPIYSRSRPREVVQTLMSALLLLFDCILGSPRTSIWDSRNRPLATCLDGYSELKPRL